VNNIWIIVAGVVLGIVAVILVNQYLQSIQTRYSLLQVKKGLKKGEEISRESLAVVAVPEHFGSVVREAVLAEDGNWVIGRRVVQDVATGDFLLYAHLVAAPDEDFDRKLDKDKRALAVDVTNETGVAGFIEPGSFVDIVATIMQPKDEQHPTPRIATTTILRKIKVLAVGDRTVRRRVGGAEQTRRGSATVTLELTPLQVEKVIFTQQHAQGPLTLVLTHPESDTEATLPSISWENFEQIR
jgi:pilus assembly protein CpaB